MMPTTAATTSAIKAATVTTPCAAFTFPSLAGTRQIPSDSQKLLCRLTRDRERVTVQVGVRYPSISLANSYGAAGVPIVPGGDGSALDERAPPRGPEREETHRSFDKRIPFLLSSPEHTDTANTKNRHSDGIEKTSDQYPQLIPQRGPFFSGNHSAEDGIARPSDGETPATDHESRGCDEPNGHADALEDDVHKSNGGTRQNPILKSFIDDHSSSIGGLPAVDMGARGGSRLSSKK
jgi:hypothetical protein